MAGMDIGVGGVVLIFLSLGWRSGMLMQVFGVVVLLISAWLARAVTLPLSEFTSRVTHLGPDGAVGACFLVFFCGLALLLTVLLHRLSGDLRDASGRGRMDRFGGGIFGALRGALLSYFVLVGLLSLGRGTGWPPLHYGAGKMGPYVRTHDFLARPADRLDALRSSAPDLLKLRGWKDHKL